jgi:hypothetical protein
MSDPVGLCSGSGKAGKVIAGFENVIPAYQWRECPAKCVDENGRISRFRIVFETGTIPNHKDPSQRNRFSFLLKWPTMCDVGRHNMTRGTKVIYSGNKLVCMAHR